jgi:hypothetical protein
MKPIAIVSIAGYDALKTNLDMIGRLSGNPKLVEGLEATLKQMTQDKGLAGLDTKRPWGIACFPRPENVPNLPKTITCGFIPVTDLKQLMDVAKSNPKLAPAINLNGDVYEISTPGGPPLSVKQKGDWAVFSIVGGDLASAPADPLELLGNLPKDYDVAIRFLVKNIPEQFRKEGASQLQSAVDRNMLPIPGASEQLKQVVPLITQLFNDLDEVTLGLKIESSTKKCHLDLVIAAKSGTKLADRFAAMKGCKTAFAGMRLPDAALIINKTQLLTDDDAAQGQAQLAAAHKKFLEQLERRGLSEDQVNLISHLSQDFVDVLQRTVAGKKIDGGFAVLLEADAATVVGGATVVDGDKLEKTLKQLADDLEKIDPETAKTIKVSARTYDGLHIHYLTVPTPDPRLVPFVGETTKVVLATAPDRVLIAAGRNAAKTLKKVIDDSKADAGTGASSNEVRVSVGKFAKFIGDVTDDKMAKKQTELLIGALGKVGDKDHVIITASHADQRMRIRVELEEGMLKALAATGQMVMSRQTMPPAGAQTPPDATPK